MGTWTEDLMSKQLNWDLNFWNLTDEQISLGLDIMYDSHLFLAEFNVANPLCAFRFNGKLQLLAMLWTECGGDRTLMKLKRL
jgi:hypothetical protein